jgi:hypothetical protein
VREKFKVFKFYKTICPDIVDNSAKERTGDVVLGFGDVYIDTDVSEKYTVSIFMSMLGSV